ANQYIAQMSQEVKDAIFGNVGSMIAFRMGVDDARSMQRYFEPKFEEYDLVHMHNRHFVINMTIGGEKSPAFSAISIDLPEQNNDETASIIEYSRAQYALHHGSVEQYIDERHNFRAPIEAKAEVKQAKPVAPDHAADKETLSSTVGHAAVAGSKVEVIKQKRKRRRRIRKPRAQPVAENAETVVFSRDKS
ncbi:MAG: hypothetical protein JWL89_29, partial [Candidatus Saccharibacteria bacterium]|nr:hypothetical protein [Candidatus Saccharibacteria bacterium]